MKPSLEVRDLGLVSYQDAYEYQLAQVKERISGKLASDLLLLVEHPNVYTFGRKWKGEAQGLPGEIAFIERGGEGTFHNPGQLVAYPILKFLETERDLHAYLRRLEESLIETLATHSLLAGRKPGATGVWIASATRKIASIGVAVRGWVSYHGIALNVCNDLAGFSAINPCGFESSVMTSMQKELGERCPSLKLVKETFTEKFTSLFYA